MPNDVDGRRSQHVVVRVRERLRRRHNDGIASMNTQGIKVLEKSKQCVPCAEGERYEPPYCRL